MNERVVDMAGHDFGPVWPGLENNPEAAIAKLMQERNGEVPKAYRHPELGWIGFVYGNEHMGLAHIAHKRGSAFLTRLPQVLRTGRVVRDEKLPRVYIADKGAPPSVAVIRLNWDNQDKTWVVTMFQDDRGKFPVLDEAEESAGQVRLSDEPPASAASRIPAATRQENATTTPESVLDAVGALERVKLSGELAGKVKELAGSQSALQRVKTAKQVADLLQRLGAGARPSKIRNFGWDAVKLSDLSMEDLETLRQQVQTEHANPRDEKGGYLENGQPSLYLYDKRGRWKLDKLAWAVTYKLQEKRRAEEQGGTEPKPSGRAPSGGTVGMNGEFYKGGTFLPSTTLPKQGKAAGGAGGGRGILIEPGVFAEPPSADARSIFADYGQFIHVDGGVASVFERPDVAIAHYVNEDVAEGRAFLRAAADAYNRGLRWFVPGDIEVTDEHREVPAPQIVEHVTKGGKGKTIRGIIRTDLTYAEAKAIDEYTFKKDGGWFIREKHLDGYVPPDGGNRPPPTPKPDLTPEELAQAEADRLADQQLRESKRRAEVGAKLRAAGESTVEKADAELGRDRLTNTSRRAGMAASILQRQEQSRAIGLTMQNLASAIESGEATHLAGITSRAAVETLHSALMSAMYEADRAANLSYSDQQRLKGRAPTEKDVAYAQFPTPKWDSAGTSRAKILEAIKGKRGAPALADRIRYSVGPDADVMRELKAVLGDKEFKYQFGWWTLELNARAERLKRAGITNTQELKDALVEYLQFREGAREEDPIKKAERALIGQKVGIDFFPTPVATAVRMASLARIKKGDRVLEPSAGNGNLADAAKSAGADVDVIEISSQLREILKAKGYNVVAFDFDGFEPEEKYDAILMNPPFSNRQDAAHIMRAHRMLKAGGHLVAIAGEGVFFGSDAKAKQFRDWLDSVGAEVESLEQGTFKDRTLLATTGANARLIIIQK